MNINVSVDELLEEEEFDRFYDTSCLLSEVEDCFSYQIKKRGSDYYNNNKILKCYHSGRQYFAKVLGSSDSIYSVQISHDEEEGIDFSCDCPYEYPCKHEYAVFLAISNGEYEEISLKPEIKEKTYHFSSILESIPAEEIKQYLLSSKVLDSVCFGNESFEKHFRKYLPKQDYEFYYNHLYNVLLLEDEIEAVTTDYLNKVKEYVDQSSFDEGYKILKSVIEAYHDSNLLNFHEYVIDMLLKVGLFLRVIYRRGEESTKKNITDWSNSLKENYYYDNYYLEDVILTLKNINL